MIYGREAARHYLQNIRYSTMRMKVLHAPRTRVASILSSYIESIVQTINPLHPNPNPVSNHREMRTCIPYFDLLEPKD
jgi:hypothetical protein